MTAAWRTQRNTIDNIRKMANIICNVPNIYSIYYVKLHRKVFDNTFSYGKLHLKYNIGCSRICIANTRTLHIPQMTIPEGL